MKTTSVTKQNTTANKTHVDIVARYFLKAALAIVYVMINGGGKKYMVTIHANGTSSCVEAEFGETCEGCHYGHVCYHKKAAFEAEHKRAARVANIGRCDCHEDALHSKADHAMMESMGAAPTLVTRVPVRVVQEVTDNCPQGDPVVDAILEVYRREDEAGQDEAVNEAASGDICMEFGEDGERLDPEDAIVLADEWQERAAKALLGGRALPTVAHTGATDIEQRLAMFGGMR